MQNANVVSLTHPDGSIAMIPAATYKEIYFELMAKVVGNSGLLNTVGDEKLSSIGKIENHPLLVAPTTEPAQVIAEKQESAYEFQQRLMKKAWTAPVIKQEVILRRVKNRKEITLQDKTRFLYASQVEGVDISDIEEVTQYWNVTTGEWNTPVVTKRAGKKCRIPAAVAIYGELAANWKRKNTGNHLSFQLTKFRYQ